MPKSKLLGVAMGDETGIRENQSPRERGLTKVGAMLSRKESGPLYKVGPNALGDLRAREPAYDKLGFKPS